MAGFFDDLMVSMFPEYSVVRSNAKLSLLKNRNEEQKLGAMANLYGGVDPTQPNAPQHDAIMPDATPGQTSFFHDGPQPDQKMNPGARNASTISIPNLTGADEPNRPGLTNMSNPDQFAALRQKWMDAADPESALKREQAIRQRQSNMDFMKGQGLPEPVQQAASTELSGAPQVGGALAKNLETPDTIKQVNYLLSNMAQAKDHKSPEFMAYSKMLTAMTQNMPAAQLTELVRHNKEMEKLEGITVGSDENGYPILIDKRGADKASTITHLINPAWNGPPTDQPPANGPGVVAAPGAAPTSPDTGAAAPGATPVPASSAGVAPPPAQNPNAPKVLQPAYNDQNFFNNVLKPGERERFANLPPALQLLVGPMMQGKVSPPEGGKALSDPKLLNLLRTASYVSPDFTEQTWRNRNKMSTELVDMTNSKLGGQRASAEKILNHATSFLKTMGDAHNNSLWGTPGNFVNNEIAQRAPDWAGQGAMQTNLTAAEALGSGTGEEFAKLMGGGAGAEAAKERAIGHMSTSANLNGNIGGVSAVADMMKGQVEPQIQAYNEAMKTNLTLEDWLGEDSAKKYKLIQDLAERAKTGEIFTSKSLKEAFEKMGGSALGVGESKKIGNATVTRKN